ncbi:uncharacterized protein LOC122577706 [Bombus pyrosoma]|uniref:uncharacterized protein LOC122577706 n=1 Tax=Bombus pyrosoma TaxID=396416 RepID=UPI001CB8EB5A|nr:uncharacterized protein LOC122577706 [Bombus pyrosoma]
MSRVIRNNDDRITLSSLVSVYKKAVKSTRKSHAFDAVACICFVRYNVPEVVKTQHMCTGDFEVAVNGPPDFSEASTGNSFAFSILLQGNSNDPRRHTYVYSQSTSKLPNITSQLVLTISPLPDLPIERSISVLSTTEFGFSVSVRFSKAIALDPTTAKSLYDETKRYGIVSNYSKAIKL